MSPLDGATPPRFGEAGLHDQLDRIGDSFLFVFGNTSIVIDGLKNAVCLSNM